MSDNFHEPEFASPPQEQSNWRNYNIQYFWFFQPTVDNDNLDLYASILTSFGIIKKSYNY